MNKLIPILIIASIFVLFGCTSSPVCGDEVCDSTENSQNCSNDCGGISGPVTQTLIENMGKDICHDSYPNLVPYSFAHSGNFFSCGGTENSIGIGYSEYYATFYAPNMISKSDIIDINVVGFAGGQTGLVKIKANLSTDNVNWFYCGETTGNEYLGNNVVESINCISDISGDELYLKLETVELSPALVFIRSIKLDKTTSINCANEGENFSKVFVEEYATTCCEGLTEWNSGMDTRFSIGDECFESELLSGYPVGTCINCGDGICSDLENPCNCLEDCEGGINADYNSLVDLCSTCPDTPTGVRPSGPCTLCHVVDWSCPIDYDPVCGVDGVTYRNACYAEFDGKVAIDYNGEC